MKNHSRTFNRHLGVIMNDFNTNLKLKTKEVEDIIYNYFPKEEGHLRNLPTKRNR